MVILAVGEKVDFEPAKEIGLEVRKNGTIRAHRPAYRTNVPKVYARRGRSQRSGQQFPKLWELQEVRRNLIL